MNQIDAVIGDIKEMFAKQPNTIYEVRFVDQIYSKKLIYFLNGIRLARLQGRNILHDWIVHIRKKYQKSLRKFVKKQV